MLATAAAALGLLVLIRFVDAEALVAAWRGFDPLLFAVAGALYVVSISARGWRLRMLSTGEAWGPLWVWLRLAAVHQALFTIMPSGTGDLGYPMLAGRLAGTPGATAVRVLFIYRFQDLMALSAFAGCGLYLLGGDLAGGTPVALAALAATAGLVAAPDLARLALLAFGRLLADMPPGGDTLIERSRRAAGEWLLLLDARVSWSVRWRTAAACLAAWCAATLSLWVLFAMSGKQLEAGEIMLLIAGMNLVGALATFTVAGLGVSEGGLAVLLALLGHGAGESAAISLTVRPLALISSLAASGVVEACARFARCKHAIHGPTDRTPEVPKS